MKIYLKPLGKIEKQVLDLLEQHLSRVFGDTVVSPGDQIPVGAFNSSRRQYNAASILDLLKSYGKYTYFDQVFGVILAPFSMV